MSGRWTRRRLVVTGVVLLVVGLAGVVASVLVGQSRTQSAVRDLARAPVGCDTTLEFSDTGSFSVFVETSGRLEDLAGTCDAPASYDLDGETPDPEVELIGPDGAAVEIVADDADGYAVDGFVGEPLGRVVIERTGRHVVRVTDDAASGFVVAIGRDPAGADEPFSWFAVASGVLGLVFGGAAVIGGVLLGSRSDGDDDGERHDRGGAGTDGLGGDHAGGDGDGARAAPIGPPLVPPPSERLPPGSPLPPPTGPPVG